MKTIVLAGGGTAGHIMPHINLKPYLDKYFDKVVYIGTTGGMEKKIVQEHGGFEYYEINAAKFNRKNIFKNILLPFRFIKSVNQAKLILKDTHPSIVFSKGGYGALPVVIAASKLKIPVVAHESDLSLGLANKISKKYSKYICTSFEKTAKKVGKKGIYTGSPSKIVTAKANIKSSKPVLLITGGSLGAMAINKAVWQSAKNLSQKFYVIHQVGKNKINKELNFKDYVQIEFSNSMPELINRADLVVSRAGSNTIFELAIAQKPMLLIPLPKGVSRGDQVDNAKYFQEKGYAKILLQENLTANTLQNAINELFLHKNKYINTLKNAKISNGTQKIIDILVKNAKK